MSATFQFQTTRPLNQVSGSTSGRWKRFTRGDCPICAGARKDQDCRRSPKGLVHCRSGADAPAGWHFVGEDSLGFGMYAQGEGETSSPIPNPKSAIAGPQLQVLDAVERDRQFRQIAKHSGLSTKHRAKLEKRGVSSATTQTWYDSGLVWSWSADSHIPGTTAELPGVDPRTGALRTFHGMAIAIPSIDGHILGTQIKSDRGQQNYFWVSSESVGGNNQRLQNGETPIGVYGPPSPTLDFCEGYLKPAVASDRHGICCVGMMGGHWANSPEQLRYTIQRTKATSFILNPDAGMLDPKHRTVILAYSRLEALLRSWGYTLQVRWWDQRDKQQGDIDEISPEQFALAPLISWDTFLTYLDYDWDVETLAAELLATSKHRLDRATLRYLRDLQGYVTPKPVKKSQKKPDQSPDIIIDPEKNKNSCVAIALYQPPKIPVLDVEPGTLPTFEEFLDMGSPQLYAPRGKHNGILAEMLQKGYRYILLNGTGGDGKTHRAGEFALSWPSVRLHIDGCKQGTLHFTSPNYRNPDTETVEKTEEKVSPAATDEDPTKLTPLGNPSRTRHVPGGGREPDNPGLCSEDATIQRLQQKGLVIDRGFQSDYCQHVCGQAFTCPYLAAKQAQGQPAVIREHISTVALTPAPENLPEGESPQNGDVIMVDEAGRTLAPYNKTITATVHDLAQELGRFADIHLSVYVQYKPVFDAISQGIKRAVAEGDTGIYEMSWADALKFLPTVEHLEWLFFQCHFEPQYASWLSTKDVWDWEGDRTVASLGELMQMLFRANSPQDWKDAIEAAKANGTTVSGDVLERWVSPQPLYRLYRAIKGAVGQDIRGNVTVSPSGLITFTYRDRRIITPLRQAKAVILMDATPNTWEIAQVLGVRQREIVHLADYRPSYPNLTIKVVQGLGNTCASRASLHADGTLVRQGQYDIQQRVVKLVKTIAAATTATATVTTAAASGDRLCTESSTAPIGLLDYRKFLDTYDIPNLVKGYCFNDNRGSNRFKGCSTLISVAIATPNLGAMLNQYFLMTGRARTLQDAGGGFWAWQRQGQINELIQDGFRLRAQHRPDEQLEWWILSDQADEGMVEAIHRAFPGCKVERVPVVQVCRDAAPKATQVRHSLVEVLYQQLAAGEDATIDAIAQQVGRSKGRISQIAKELDSGGFRAVRKSLELLFKSLNSKIKLSELPEDAQFLALHYLPDLADRLLKGEIGAAQAQEEFQTIAETYPESEFEAILAATPADAIATLIATFLPLAGDGVLGWVTAGMRSRLDYALGVP